MPSPLEIRVADPVHEAAAAQATTPDAIACTSAPPQVEPLVQAVQANCHIADARHAGDMTLCTYLLQMREFFRWERGIGLGRALDRDAVGAWIAGREVLWNEVEQRDYEALPLPLPPPAGPFASTADPFDADAVNAAIAPLGLVYGAGLIGGYRPVFFLAQRHAASEREGLVVLQGGREWARGLLAPPAALAGGGRGPIVVRRESLARWCWERVEAHGRPQVGPAASDDSERRKRGGTVSAMRAMLDSYGLDADFDAALPRWLDDQVETAVLHELGEHRASRMLGSAWNEMRAALNDMRAAGLATALRDHLADTTVTLPALLDRGEPAPLHAWFAAYDGPRTLLWPDLPRAYAAWHEGDRGAQLRREIDGARRHFEALSARLLDTWRSRGAEGAAELAAMLNDARSVCRSAG